MNEPDGTELASAEQIRDIADRAHDILLDALQEEWDDPEHEATDRLPLAFDALRFCARAAEELGDPSLFESIADAFALRVALEDDYPEDDADVLARATAKLLGCAPRLGTRAIELASDPSPEVRRAIAQGLRPEVPGAMALLRKLVADVEPAVRSAARESLGDAGDSPWWTGVLSADPAALVGEAAAAKARPVLEEVLAKLSLAEHARPTTFPEIAKLLRGLPRVLAAEVAERALLLADYATKDSIEPLAKVMLAGAGAEAALARVMKCWCEGGHPTGQKEPLAKAIAALPPRRRAAHCRRLAEAALAATEEERLEMGSTAAFGAEVAADAWPKALDYGFVLDGIDAIERDGDSLDWAVVRLARLLDVSAPRAAHVPRLVDRLTRPPSESWREVHGSISTHLAKLPSSALRPIADRAAASGERMVLRWALELLASRLHTKKDPPLGDLLRAWVDDERLCAVVAVSPELSDRALPWLREKLREGKLDCAAAVYTVLAFDGGLGGIGRVSRAASAPVLTIDAKDWVAYRAIRDAAALEELDLWPYALNALPKGRRQPEDRAFLARAIQAVGTDRGLMHWLLYTLRCASDEEALAEATAVMAATSGDDRDKARAARDEIAKKLGVPPPPDPVDVAVTAAVPVGLPRTGEWMDEPDEEPWAGR